MTHKLNTHYKLTVTALSTEGSSYNTNIVVNHEIGELLQVIRKDNVEASISLIKLNRRPVVLIEAEGKRKEVPIYDSNALLNVTNLLTNFSSEIVWSPKHKLTSASEAQLFEFNTQVKFLPTYLKYHQQGYNNTKIIAILYKQTLEAHLMTLNVDSLTGIDQIKEQQTAIYYAIKRYKLPNKYPLPKVSPTEEEE